MSSCSRCGADGFSVSPPSSLKGALDRLTLARCRLWLWEHWQSLVLCALLPVAMYLRLYGLNWDQGLLFHPDERKILMVVERLAWPESPLALFSSSSSLNPGFFAYGSLPLYLLRLGISLLAMRWPEWTSISRYYVLGRALSATFDTLTVWATYLLAKKVFDRRVAILAAAFMTFTVLHIQLAHFYTVDTLLTLLVVLSLSKAIDVLQRGRQREAASLGLCLGAALATKVSVLPLFAVAMLAWTLRCWESVPRCPGRREHVVLALREAMPGMRMTLFAAVLCFLLLEPYALIDAYRFAVGIGQEIAMSQGWYDFPYTRQYIGTARYLYPLQQTVLFATGMPLGLLGLTGLAWLVVQLWKHKRPALGLFLSWPLLYALLQGAAHAKFLRYALPILPFLSVGAAALLAAAWDRAGRKGQGWPGWTLRVMWVMVAGAVVGSTVWYAMAFLNIYRQPHAWIEASRWLCEHAPAGSTILTEYWDDPLPARGGCCAPEDYYIIQFDMYGPDTEGDMAPLVEAIARSDYIALSSQRLYAPIVRLAERYPLAGRYYRQLFAGSLGFELVAAPAVYPQACGITLLHDPRAGLGLDVPRLSEPMPGGAVVELGQADESFVVYDHPQPLIFAKRQTLGQQQLRTLLEP